MLELLLATPAGAQVAQVLRRFQREGDIDEARGHQALEALRDLDVARYCLPPMRSSRVRAVTAPVELLRSA